MIPKNREEDRQMVHRALLAAFLAWLQVDTIFMWEVVQERLVTDAVIDAFFASPQYIAVPRSLLPALPDGVLYTMDPYMFHDAQARHGRWVAEQNTEQGGSEPDLDSGYRNR